MRTTIVVLLLLAAPVIGAAELDPISSAEVCGRCHRAIHAAWKVSAHANSMESRLFQDMLELVAKDFSKSDQKTCLGCHGPLALSLGDIALTQKISWEGVTCDYCHSMRGVSMDGPHPRAKLQFSSVKSGPLKNATSGAHGTIFSDVHSSSLVCAPCHEYRNAAGLGVLTTFSEWRGSRYFEEHVQCQSCHMARVAGNVVEPRVKRSTEVGVNLHEMPGGHSLEQLNKAVKARLITGRTKDHLEVSVELSNVGAGHYLPTGSPMRELILEVEVDAYRGEDFHETRTYRRVVVDKDGQPFTREYAALFNAERVQSDSRLAPDETRTESFSFAIPQDVPCQVSAKLTYRYSPVAGPKYQQQVTFRNISRFVK